jgi:hypothetical protein
VRRKCIGVGDSWSKAQRQKAQVVYFCYLRWNCEINMDVVVKLWSRGKCIWEKATEPHCQVEGQKVVKG